MARSPREILEARMKEVLETDKEVMPLAELTLSVQEQQTLEEYLRRFSEIELTYDNQDEFNAHRPQIEAQLKLDFPNIEAIVYKFITQSNFLASQHIHQNKAQ